jgi:hypothetical protein
LLSSVVAIWFEVWQIIITAFTSVFDYQWQFTFVLYFHSLLYSLLYIVGPLSKLTETSFFCWRSHKYELLLSEVSTCISTNFVLESSHIWTYLIWELWFYVTEMRKKKSKVRFVESSFGQKIWSAFSIAHSIFHIASPYQNGAIVVCLLKTNTNSFILSWAYIYKQ